MIKKILISIPMKRSFKTFLIQETQAQNEEEIQLCFHRARMNAQETPGKKFSKI